MYLILVKMSPGNLLEIIPSHLLDTLLLLLQCVITRAMCVCLCDRLTHAGCVCVTDCRGFVSPDCPAVNQIVDSLDEIQYLTELNDADISSVQSIFEDHSLHALLSVCAMIF